MDLDSGVDFNAFIREYQFFDQLAFFHWQRDISYFSGNKQAAKAWGILYAIYAKKGKKTQTTPLMFAAHHGLRAIIPSLLYYFGYTARLKNSTGTTALMFAAEQGYTAIVAQLLPYSDVNATNAEEVTALMLAAQNNYHNTVCVLINTFGIELDRVDYEGVSALMFAVQNGHSKIVRELLRAGASTEIRATNGDTVWTLATRFNQPQILKILEQGPTRFLPAGKQAKFLQENHHGLEIEPSVTVLRPTYVPSKSKSTKRKKIAAETTSASANANTQRESGYKLK